MFCELEISLPEAVAVLPLESTLSPDFSGLWNSIVQSSLDEDLMDGCVADSALLRVVTQIDFDAAWSPVSCPSELKYEVHGGLWGSMDRVGLVRFDS